MNSGVLLTINRPVPMPALLMRIEGDPHFDLISAAAVFIAFGSVTSVLM